MEIEMMAANAGAEQAAPEGIATPEPIETAPVQTETIEQPTAVEPQATPETTETQRVAQRIKEVRETAERERQEALDAFAREAYGSQGITTHAEYLEAKKRAEYQQKYDVDPEAVRPLLNEMLRETPEFQELQALRMKTQIAEDVRRLQKEFSELGIESEADLPAKIPNWEQVIEDTRNTGSVTESHWRINRDRIMADRQERAVQAALAKVTANGIASPGSLGAGADTPAFFTREQVANMTTQQVMDNYDSIKKSQKKW